MAETMFTLNGFCKQNKKDRQAEARPSLTLY